MNRHTLAALMLIGTAAMLSSLSRVGHAGDEAELAGPDAHAQAVAMWGSNCRKCHAGTDTTFATDRAFLRRITVTT